MALLVLMLLRLHETQIRDTLSRRFLRWTSKPQKNGAPGSTDDSPMYGLGYEKPVIQNTVLKRMADFGCTPEDITVRMDSGKPNVVLSPEKAKEIVYAQSGGVGPDDLGNKMPVYAHRFGGGSGLGKLLTGDLDFTDDDADGAIGMLYFDGASSGGLDVLITNHQGDLQGSRYRLISETEVLRISISVLITLMLIPLTIWALVRLHTSLMRALLILRRCI